MFLNDKAKYCYDLQLDFLKIRSKQRLLGKNGEYSCVKDRSLPEDIMVFCQMFYEDGYLTRSELDMLSCEFKKVNKELPSSDLLIVLKGSSEKAWKHIQQRGREIEVEGGWSYSEIRTLYDLEEEQQIIFISDYLDSKDPDPTTDDNEFLEVEVKFLGLPEKQDFFLIFTG